jgi:hypothetical protein
MINNISIKKVILYILIPINILFIILYKIEKVKLSKNNLIFRGWVDITYQISIMILIILVIIFVKICLISLFELIIKNCSIKNFFKKLFTGIMAIFIIICFLLGSLNIALSYYPEHTVYIQGRKVIAKVGPSFLHTTVNFYEPVNIFSMKSSGIPSETYKGGYDKYK